ncbi:MAG: RnfABCDGE type electron transport complex subunit D [Sedimentisphaerales bacterium]|nr:RnfABCDGE type electron transport complex subunit D [Sedimentisphaerales bacterium]
MNEEHNTYSGRQAPFVVCPESALRIMHTQLAALLIPAAGAVWLFGFAALRLMVLATVTAGVTEFLISSIKGRRQGADFTHSLMMGLLLAFTLPAWCAWYIVVLGTAFVIVAGKAPWGGLGRYRWHPALLGRLAVQIIFSGQLNGPVDPGSGSGFEALRHWRDIEFINGVPQIGQYISDHLPALQKVMWGDYAGGLGETAGLILIFIGIFFIYRGYLHWQLPLFFILSTYVMAAVCPVPARGADGARNIIYLPLLAENLSSGFTYMNYHIFSGGLLLAACIISVDMTCRPMTVRGQTLFGVGAGVLTILIRLYCPSFIDRFLCPISAYSAVLIMNTAVPLIDRVTRPRSK